ncbi:hypothetical protein CDAR_85561 [Caerostris darwini]|uniref:Uncharacterized protein n=1 Tax=Caerostris darwini TaxID=1538125 RepID=A0AAV4R078_9ARAC|nr:hypothetical protein CDAR_85561 [Caerostris darwini]
MHPQVFGERLSRKTHKNRLRLRIQNFVCVFLCIPRDLALRCQLPLEIKTGEIKGLVATQLVLLFFANPDKKRSERLGQQMSEQTLRICQEFQENNAV